MKNSFSIDFYASNLLFLSILFMNFALSTHRKRFLLFLSLCPVCLCPICSLLFFSTQKNRGLFSFSVRYPLSFVLSDPKRDRPDRVLSAGRLRPESQRNGQHPESGFCRKMAWCWSVGVDVVHILCRVTKMGGWIANICQWRRMEFCSIMQIYCSGRLARGKN